MGFVRGRLQPCLKGKDVRINAQRRFIPCPYDFKELFRLLISLQRGEHNTTVIVVFQIIVVVQVGQLKKESQKMQSKGSTDDAQIYQFP
jgi:hypothetical protein